jgi:hypothetical protein
MVSDIHFLVVEKHAIDSLDCTVRGFSCLVMDEPVAFGTAVFVSGHFAR